MMICLIDWIYLIEKIEWLFVTVDEIIISANKNTHVTIYSLILKFVAFIIRLTHL